MYNRNLGMNGNATISVSRYATDVNSLTSLFEDVAKSGTNNQNKNVHHSSSSVHDRVMVMDRLLNLLGEQDKKIKALERKNEALTDKKCVDYEKEIKALRNQIKTLTNGKKRTIIPVFSVRECRNPVGKAKNRILGFSNFNFETNSEYGEFHLYKGVFAVKKSGTYHFNFGGLVARTTESKRAYQFELRVDGATKSACRANSTTEGLQQVVLSIRQHLLVGQKVVMIRVSGGLYEAPNVSSTTFSCKFIDEN